MIKIFITERCRPTPTWSYKVNASNSLKTLLIYMMEMFFNKICRPPPDSYKTNAQNSIRALFIDMIEMFIMKRCISTPPGSYKTNLKIQ